uniref:Uncharacterized protein n=1 Tax=Oryzias melastigma TaxID=30732 RepID=A0A3B3DKZ7_ORYME
MAKITSCCVALFLMLAAVAAVPRRFNSIKDLPTDTRTLLYWFAQNVKIYSNEIWLNFDPSTGSFGSHYYRNYEGLLETLPRGYGYYTIGINNDGSFPDYVLNADEENRTRIIIRVRRDNNRQADRVYITRHTGNHHDSGYDSSQTYEVTVNVLQELARLSLNEIQRSFIVRKTCSFPKNDGCWCSDSY